MAAARRSLLKRPPDMETPVPAVVLWLAITLVATKLPGHFTVNAVPASRAESARDSPVTLGHSVEFVKTSSSIALLSGAPYTYGGIGTPRQGALVPVYCCCRQQPAQYSTLSESWSSRSLATRSAPQAML